MQINNERKGFVLGILATICWGLTFIVVKKGVTVSNPLVLTFFRLALALPLMFFFRPKHSILLMLGFTLIWNVAAYNLMGLGMSYGVSASAASFLQQSSSLFFIIASVFFLKEKLTPNIIISLLLAFTGLIIFFDVNPRIFNGNIGLLLILLAAIIWAVGMVCLKKLKIDGSISTVIWLAGLAAFIQAPMTFAFVPAQEIVFSMDIVTYGITAFILSNIIASVLWLKATQLSHSASLSQIVLLIPIVVLIADYFIMGNTIQPHELIGGGLIIFAGIYRFGNILKRKATCEEMS